MKPIKVVFENDVEIIGDDFNIEIVQKVLTFGTEFSIFDCSGMTKEEIDRIIEEFNNIPLVNPIRTEDLKKILES